MRRVLAGLVVVALGAGCSGERTWEADAYRWSDDVAAPGVFAAYAGAPSIALPAEETAFHAYLMRQGLEGDVIGPGQSLLAPSRPHEGSLCRAGAVRTIRFVFTELVNPDYLPTYTAHVYADGKVGCVEKTFQLAGYL